MSRPSSSPINGSSRRRATAPTSRRCSTATASAASRSVERRRMSHEASERRLRVAHVTLGLNTGGQEKLLVEFARHADRAGHELTFVSLESRGKLAEQLEDLGGRVIALEEPAGLRPRMIGRLARLFRRERFN